MEVRKCSLDAYNPGLFSSSFLLQTACQPLEVEKSMIHVPDINLRIPSHTNRWVLGCGFHQRNRHIVFVGHRCSSYTGIYRKMYGHRFLRVSTDLEAVVGSEPPRSTMHISGSTDVSLDGVWLLERQMISTHPLW